MVEERTMTLNMGPQHPATHGVLRLILELDGEIVRKVTPVLGHLHRGIEKLAEVKTYHQCIPLTDRMDYVNAMGHNLGYVRFFMPLRFFPEWFVTLCRLTPFPAMVNTIVEIYLGVITGWAVLQALLVQAFWVIILVAIGQLVLRIGVKRLVIQGG